MPELKKFYTNHFCPEQNGELITFDLIRGYATADQKVNLIKLLRVVSGLGLKDAKEGVENNCCDIDKEEKNGWDGRHYYVANPDKAVAYFAKFLGPFPTEAEIKAEEDAKTGKTMIEACAFAFANWKLLCYETPYDAVRQVIDRYQDMNERQANK